MLEWGGVDIHGFRRLFTANSWLVLAVSKVVNDHCFEDGKGSSSSLP